MKKALVIITVGIALFALSFTPIWGYIYSAFEAKGIQGNYSQLRFEALKGDYEIYIDEELKGEVLNKEKRDFPQIKPGTRKVKISRKSEVDGFFYMLERNIDFIPSSQVEIEWDAGPTLESSSGTIKYFSQIVKPSGAEVYIRPFPNNATVEFDSKITDGNTFEVFDTKTHTISVKSSDNFEERISKINLTDGSTNKVIPNIKLIIEVYLYKVPFESFK